ncbi:MAG TPA: hypothetical protein VL525_21950 [Mucilaginibacter sp.]|nr:hypothetical protein [Mucilaginibacter sp.]
MKQINFMDEHLFLKGQRVNTPEGEGEVVDAIGDKIVVKLDSGATQTFPADELQDHSSAG